MSVKDLKKQLDKCDADHEQQLKDCKFLIPVGK